MIRFFVFMGLFILWVVLVNYQIDELFDNYKKVGKNNELEQQCKKQKEVIDKVKEFIYIVQNNKENKHLEPVLSVDELDEILDILKEV